MRGITMTLLILPVLMGCGPNRKIEAGKETITKVETIPAGSQKIIPTGPGQPK